MDKRRLLGYEEQSRALGAIVGVPEDVIWADWLLTIVHESKEVSLE